MPSDPAIQPLRTILVPTDFSAPARRALEWAIELAKAHQARLVLMHAVEPSLAGSGRAIDRALDEAASSKLLEAGRPIIEARLAMDTDCRVGKPWAAIRDAAEDFEVDLIVMGSRGLTGLDRVLLGSTADRVLRTAAPPVLTIHPDADRPAFRHVLVATDFSASSAAALASARRLVHFSLQPVQVTLLHVSPPPYLIGSLEVPITLLPNWDEIDKDLEHDLDALAGTIRNDRIITTSAVVRGTAARVILDEVQGRRPDLVALGTQGRSATERLFVGSVAERVLHHAGCPVLTARVAAKAEAGAAGGGERAARGPRAKQGARPG